MPKDKIPMMVDVVLEFIDQEGNTYRTEHTVTDFVTSNGARVFLNHEVAVGELLELKLPDGSFSSPAIVKDTLIGNDRIPRLILEFLGSGWQQKWLYSEEQAETTEEYTDPLLGRHSRPDDYYETLLKISSDTSMLLQIVISELASGQPPDLVFLNELKDSVDQLRSILFRIQKSAKRLRGEL
ncbi:MAG: hypothetical protein RMM17_07020 [Acidobacteriota bacterium]|nr:hypothetical protein [Blastocatellia bacterium]MDW8412415.1 hypothetical protein [Acidobacteriota bacterium]